MEDPISSSAKNLEVLVLDEEEDDWLVVEEEEEHVFVKETLDVEARTKGNNEEIVEKVTQATKSAPSAYKSEDVRNIAIKQTPMEVQATRIRRKSGETPEATEESEINELGTCSVPTTYVGRRWKRADHGEPNVWECILKDALE